MTDVKARALLTENEVVLRNLAVPNFLGQRVLPVVNVGVEPEAVKTCCDLRSVLFLYPQNTTVQHSSLLIINHVEIDAHRGPRRG
jgi:hypothetical protein